ncbi:hypothetical protein [Mucilaginibacter defluvii]|uniref:PsbP C-terminal domain-containing protein n=1 Tax=Mucilaginibacter defluvii TaxID=1196019 RepID=A0ABP9FQS0_9SPHI
MKNYPTIARKIRTYLLGALILLGTSEALVFILLAAFWVKPAFSQTNFREVNVVEVAVFSLPKNASNVAPGTKRVASDNSTYVIPKSATAANIGNIFIQLNGATGNTDPNYLQNLENNFKALDKSLGGKSGWNFINKFFNDYHLLLIEQLHPYDANNAKYTFFCLSKDKRSVVSGAIEFPMKERLSGKRELDKLLSSIHFK